MFIDNIFTTGGTRSKHCSLARCGEHSWGPGPGSCSGSSPSRTAPGRGPGQAPGLVVVQRHDGVEPCQQLLELRNENHLLEIVKLLHK